MSSCSKVLHQPITSRGQEDGEPSDGEQSVQSSAYNKLFFPSMWATRQNITEIRKQIEALIVFKLQYILGYGICLMMSLMAEVLKKN